METKKCPKCNEVKQIDQFSKNKNTKSGYNCYCKKCVGEYGKKHWKKNKNKLMQQRKKRDTEIKEYRKKYYIDNLEYHLNYQKEYRIKNKEQISKQRKEYYEENKELIIKKSTEKQIKRLQDDPIYRLKVRHRQNINRAFKNHNTIKGTNTESILGCSYDFFREYIKAQFVEGMTLDNYGEWELDHLVPLDSAVTEDDVYRLNHYTNFQPLWKVDNIRKGISFPNGHQKRLL